MTRPSVAANVVAEVTENAPGRVRRKLDKDPTAADAWEWSVDGADCVVGTGSETVRFCVDERGQVARTDDVVCSCLLSPRCFHVLACLSVMEISGGEEPETDATASGESESAEQPEPEEPLSAAETQETFAFSDDQLRAAEMVWSEAADFLASGARSAGVLLQSRLLRAIHECRAVGLHRLANAGLRVTTSTRQLRAGDAEFSPDVLAADLGELLRVAWRVQARDANPSPDARLVGTARRKYSEVSNLKLQGLFCEPINSRAGHSGIVTYVIDADGRLASVSNVRPGEGNRINAAWESPIDVGGLTLSHRELSARGLLVQTGTMSADRRLGTGKVTRAAAMDGDGWNADCVRKRFAEPLRDQVERTLSILVEEPQLWPAGYDLLFLCGTVIGSDGYACLLQLDGDQGTVRLVADDEAEGLPHADNLETLSRGSGMRLDCVARLSLSQPSTAIALAVAPGKPVDQDDATTADPVNEPAATLELLDEWPGHVNLGLHRLRSANIREIEIEPQYIPGLSALPPDGLAILRSRVEALAVGGRHSLPTGRVKELQREAMVLKEQMQPTAGALLLSLAGTALDSETSFHGVRFPADAGPLAERWLACCQYERIARMAFQRDCWLGSSRTGVSTKPG